jgi:protein-L-isoaspartate(D-aspartate) O-methyltransferase
MGGSVTGWPACAPYDAILVAAGARTIPQDLVDQLAEGGRLVVPVGDRKQQTLLACSLRNGRLERRRVCSCSFVPLIGRSGWEPPGETKH